MPISVTYSKSFISLMQNLSKEEVKLIGDFITMLKTSGFSALPGRNKPSTGVSKKHRGRVKLIQYAIANHLWHYHIGHVQYDQSKPFGDWTSSHVVHYQNEMQANSIRFVHYDSHPPMKMPDQKTLV
ncbi:hypothetical protein HF675_13585 [Serratia sp. JUb9]|uniref:hypothetical protein n=1 Tax=Serratia sp. JUb9 TaxID=2724469 RepID=UPI00164D44D4|nr:hypothetical protein [Serratia sp. JUb9]QNK30681.1 hypothetical protein HF675_13585 [Serratia sp. JUb9]QPT15449.1 hypothetical protein I6G37_11085 [Serratia rubidaea]